MAKPAHVPRLFVLAGTNGAGKSSIGGATIRARGGQYFNPDEAAARIRQAQPHLSATQANSAAWHEGKRLLQHAIAHGMDYNFETTLGGKSFSTLLKDAAAKGFEVRIWYVGLASPEHHLARVKARVKKGGHDIPEADIRRRFDQSRLQLIELLPSFGMLLDMVRSSDTVALVPERLLQGAPGLVAQRPPLAVAGFTKVLAWHARSHADPGLRWVREQLVRACAPSSQAATNPPSADQAAEHAGG